MKLLIENSTTANNILVNWREKSIKALAGRLIKAPKVEVGASRYGAPGSIYAVVYDWSDKHFMYWEGLQVIAKQLKLVK